MGAPPTPDGGVTPLAASAEKQKGAVRESSTGPPPDVSGGLLGDPLSFRRLDPSLSSPVQSVQTPLTALRV